jgi:pimeloyl-ACP methyl ester carboxylesterase
VGTEAADLGRADVIAVEFAGPGALTLRGQRWGDGDRWAVLVHGEGRDLDGWRPLAAWLAERGFTVLAFDLPGHGASDDPWEPALALPAVVSAIDFARSENAQHVHLVGDGVGAMAALAAAADPEHQVASIVAISPCPDDRAESLIDIREARAPKLMVVGSLSPGALEGAEAVFRGAIGPCEMVQFPVASQGTDLLAGVWGVHAREKVLEHLVRQR